MPNDGSKILVVDDESVIRELIADILTDEGYDVEIVADGAAALEILREPNDFGVLFTDIMMPRMDGIELIREARQINPNLIPIVMTGYATIETARAAVKEGAYDYVLKPFSLSEIKLAVSNALERYSLENENARLREITELFNISESIATFHDERKLLDFVLRAALNRVNAERGSLMLMSPDGSELEIAASIGLPQELAKATVNVDKSISGWVARHSLPLCVEDIEQNPDLRDISRKLTEGSFVSVPLERKQSPNVGVAGASSDAGPRVLAVLNITQKKGGGQFTEGDLKILSIVANHASVALENVRLMKDLEVAHLSTLQSMARVLEAKDTYTHGHSERVRNYSVMAAMKLDMTQEDVETLRLGAMLHDVGKIGVPDTVLNKVERLTSEEWGQIKLHPVIGFDILEPVQFLTKDHLELVRSHHERLDGSGYPDGLEAAAINDRVRVIAVADTYDAMSGDRAYRKGLSIEKIVSELKRCSGGQLDEKVCDLFINLIDSGEIARYASLEPHQGS